MAEPLSEEELRYLRSHGLVRSGLRILIRAGALQGLLAALDQRTQERDEARAEATRVCDQPGCAAAVVRDDTGGRCCSAGHASRWVEKADYDALRARVKELEAERDLLVRVAGEARYLREHLEDAAAGLRDVSEDWRHIGEWSEELRHRRIHDFSCRTWSTRALDEWLSLDTDTEGGGE